MRQCVNFRTSARDPLAGRPDRQLRHRGGEQARVARVSIINQHAVLRADFKDDKSLPVHRGRCVPHHQVHARLPRGHQTGFTDSRRPRHGGHRPARRAPVRHVVRRLASSTPFGEGSARAHVAQPARLRRARGIWHAAAASRPSSRPIRKRIRRFLSAPQFVDELQAEDTGGGSRAGLRARRAHPRHLDTVTQPHRQTAYGVYLQPRQPASMGKHIPPRRRWPGCCECSSRRAHHRSTSSCSTATGRARHD